MIGSVTTAAAVRVKAQALLETWLPSIVFELARRESLDINLPKSWKRLADFRAMKADQSPAIIVTSPGLEGEPVRDGDGVYSATWLLNAYVVVRGQSYEEVADRVGVYVAAMRTAFLQHRIDLEGARKADWIGENYNELSADSTRTIGAGMVIFRIQVGDVVDSTAGPEMPPSPPLYEDEDAPEAETVTVSVAPVDE